MELGLVVVLAISLVSNIAFIVGWATSDRDGLLDKVRRLQQELVDQRRNIYKVHYDKAQRIRDILDE